MPIVELEQSAENVRLAARDSIEAAARDEFSMIALTIALKHVEAGQREAAQRDISSALLGAYNRGKERKI